MEIVLDAGNIDTIKETISITFFKKALGNSFVVIWVIAICLLCGTVVLQKLMPKEFCTFEKKILINWQNV